jgi:hypothetical protein
MQLIAFAAPNGHRISEDALAAINAETGSVTIHARSISPTIVQRTSS